MMTFAEQHIFIDLDLDQQKAAYSPASRLCIIASAGSGKTRVLVKRIEYLVKSKKCQPEQILAITFTRKAGFELANRVSNIFGDSTRERPIVGTLHSFALSELKEFHNNSSTKIRNLVENPIDILKKLEIRNASKYLRLISWCKTRFIDVINIDNESFRKILKRVHASNNESLDYFKNAFEKYQNYLKKNGLMDHDDLLLEYSNRLNNKNYLETRRYLYRHLLVDEFQDTTPLHMSIYQKLVGENGSITVVGDPNQSIFSFAGSSDTYLNNFADFFVGSEILFLNKNYRSTKANVEVSLSVIKNESENNIEAVRPSSILPQIHVYSDEKEEAKSVINIISNTHAKGIKLNDIAVLVRTNSQKQLFIEAANRLGIKYHVGRHEFKSEFEKEIWSQISSLRKKRKWKSIYDALDDINSLDNFTNSDLAGEDSNILLKLRRAAKEYMSLFPHDKHGDVNGFFEYIREQLDISNSDKAGFSLLTFHQSKGLEFNTVIVSGFEKGLVPLYSDRLRLKEEARLAYVAMSRALDELHITRACVRNRHDQILVTQESPFLKDIKNHISQLDIRNDLFSPQEAIKRIEDIRAKYIEKTHKNKS